MKFLDKIRKLISYFSSSILLSLAYFLGIGLTFFVARLNNKHFLEPIKKYKTTSFVKSNLNKNLEKMF